MKFDRKNEEILGLISLTIDFPCRLMNRFECSGRSAYRTIEKMIDDGYIKRYRKDGISSLRIMKKGQSILMDNNPDRFERTIEKKRYSRSDLVKRLRLHRVASTYATMRNSDVKIYADEKPDLFSSINDFLATKTPVTTVLSHKSSHSLVTSSAMRMFSLLFIAIVVYG